MIKINFIVPYASLHELVKKILEEHPQRELLTYSIIPKRVDELDKKDFDADIVIARGLTANYLKTLDVPLIDMTITGFDITVALYTCIKQYNPSNIAVIGPSNTIYGIEEIKNILPCRIESYFIDDSELVGKTIERALADGTDAIIAGLTVYNYCSERNIPCILIETGPKTIRQAIDEAIRSVILMKKEQERTDRFKCIMDYSMEGIISIDHFGKITVANTFATRVFPQLEQIDRISLTIDKILPQLNVMSVIQNEGKILGELLPIKDRIFTINCVPAGDAGAIVTFATVSKIQEIEGKIRSKLHKKGLTAKYTFENIIGTEKSIVEAKQIAQKFSKVDSNIFIYGETGTGKELFVQSIHNESRRRNEPFVAINCAALSEDLLESELFGYEEGAFTGAIKGGKAGLFELAHNGTIFLDEIGDISLKMQSRLLRVLQEREIMRIGHGRVIPINIRIITASNKDLKTLVSEGKFRQDLYYRLNILQLSLPPLRERKQDILELCRHFIQMNQTLKHLPITSFTPDAQRLLIEHSWPGNIRELSNFCERLCVLAEDEVIDAGIVELCIDQTKKSDSKEADTHILASQAAKHERDTIIQALATCPTKREAANLLGIDPSTLWRKIKKYGLV